MNLDRNKEELLIELNRKIKEDSFEDYFDFLKKNEIFSILSLYMNSSSDVIEMYVLKDKSKRELIKYIKENLETILRINFNYIFKDDLVILKEMVGRIKEKDYNISDLNISVNLLRFFKRFYFAQFEYNSNVLNSYMPKETVDTFLKLLNDNNALNENHRTFEIMNYIMYVTSAYGIIDLTSLHRLCEKQLFKISKDKLLRIIKDFEDTYEYIHVYDSNDVLVCSDVFNTEDIATDFYNSQSSEYKEYSLSELKEIYDGKYVKNLGSYKEFIEYLNDVFDLSDEDISYIIDFLIMNYIHLSYLDKENANECFLESARDMFDLPDEEIEHMREITERIYLEGPKWEFRGNI